MRSTVLVLLVPLVLLASGCTDVFQPATGDRTAPGERAGDYLRAQPYTRILVELDFVAGAQPEESAVNLLEQRLESVSGKPVDVVRTAGVPGRGATHKYTLDEVVALERAHRDQFSSGDRAVLYVLYLDGGFEQDTQDRRVLGATYRGSSMVMFKDNLRSASRSGPLDLTRPPLTAVEQSVIVHELGHVLGLVDCGTPMVTPHADPEHRCHSSNQNSVMYWAVEVSAIGAVLGQSPPNDFDRNDRADLQAARQG